MLNLFQHPSLGKLRTVKPERAHCVYILASQPRGTLYIGVTSDLVKLLYQHREGITGGFTSQYRVHRLVRFEMFGDMEQAILREKQLKRWHRDRKIGLIESENPDGHDLAVGLGFAPLAPSGGHNGP